MFDIGLYDSACNKVDHANQQHSGKISFGKTFSKLSVTLPDIIMADPDKGPSFSCQSVQLKQFDSSGTPCQYYGGGPLQQDPADCWQHFFDCGSYVGEDNHSCGLPANLPDHPDGTKCDDSYNPLKAASPLEIVCKESDAL